MRSNDVGVFLKFFDFDVLTGKDEMDFPSPVFDEEGCRCNNVTQFFGKHALPEEDEPHISLHRAVPSKLDCEALSPHFGYKSKDIIKKMLAQTTQLAKAVMRHPIVQRFKSKYKMLRMP